MTHRALLASVIVPANNEAAVIDRLLHALTRDGEPHEVIVVCNGCRDDTAARARAHGPAVHVIEMDAANKTTAINRGLEAARAPVSVIADADVVLTGRDVSALAAEALKPGVRVVQPRVLYPTRHLGPLVKAHLRAWRRHPYMATRVGYAYALSRAGRRELGAFPDVTADDEYVRRRLFHGAVWTSAATVRVYLPATVGALIRTRSRALRGARLMSASHRMPPPAVPSFWPRWARMLASPAVFDSLVYAGVTLAARVRAHRYAGVERWARDDTTRQPGIERGSP